MEGSFRGKREEKGKRRKEFGSFQDENEPILILPVYLGILHSFVMLIFRTLSRLNRLPAVMKLNLDLS